MLCALLMLTRPGKGTGTLCIQLTNVQISIKISHKLVEIEAESIPLTYIYISRLYFLDLEQTLQYKVAGLASFNDHLNEIRWPC